MDYLNIIPVVCWVVLSLQANDMLLTSALNKVG